MPIFFLNPSALLTCYFSQNDPDEEENNDEGDDEGDPQAEAAEYKRLIAIHAGKPKGGLDECLKVDPDKVRRLSLSEQQLEKAVETHGKDIVRYSQYFFIDFVLKCYISGVK